MTRIATFLLLLTTCSIARAQQVLTVDASKAMGPIALLHGTNAGPMAMNIGADYTSMFKELGLRAIRTHDYYGPCDWTTIFPDWNADPSNPASYRFLSSDTVMQKIRAGGFEFLFRLGVSWRGSNPLPINDPPGTIRDASGNVTHAADSADFVKFADICKHIVMHYNAGWANGFQYNIKRWEIWNEPTLAAQFWSGTPLQFFQMFATVAKMLRAYDETLLVGGPGMEGHASDKFFNDFIAYLKRSGTPLDFYSFHSYGGRRESSSPWDLGKKAITARIALDANGMSGARLYCTEFNAEVNANNYANSGRGAAFYASAFTYFADHRVTEAYQYRADNHPLGLVLQGGTLKIAAESYRAWSRLVALPQRIEALGTDTLGFTSIATSSPDRKTIRVILSNFPNVNRKFTLQFLRLDQSANSRWIFTRRLIDNTHRLSLADSAVVTAGATFAWPIDIGGESVELIELQYIGPTHVDRDANPSTITLEQNYPNPFSTSTMLHYRLSTSSLVQLDVVDLFGRKVATLVDDEKPAGNHAITFRPREYGIVHLGVFWIVLRTPTKMEKRMVVSLAD